MYKYDIYTCWVTGNHKVIPTCKCGQNAICHNCGYGHGAIPCNCSQRIILKAKKNGDIEWQPAALIELKAIR